MRLKIAKQLLLTTICVAAMPAGASTVNDPAGDYLATYTGSKVGDLDILSASVTYNPGTDVFHFESMSAAALGVSLGQNGAPSGFFILGFDRGAGTARFNANGLPNVLFDSVVRLNFDGSGAVNLLAPTSSSTAIAAGTFSVQGAKLIADIAGSLLPSNGFAKADYTWNLWPRDAAATGATGNFFQISDFAPDTVNAGVQVVPIPGAFWLFAPVLAWFKLARHGSRRLS